MSPRLGGEVLDKEDNDDAAHDRCQYDCRSPRTRRRMQTGVVANGEMPEKKEVVDEADQHPKGVRPEAGGDAQKHCETRERERAPGKCASATRRLGACIARTAPWVD